MNDLIEEIFNWNIGELYMLPPIFHYFKNAHEQIWGVAKNEISGIIFEKLCFILLEISKFTEIFGNVKKLLSFQKFTIGFFKKSSKILKIPVISKKSVNFLKFFGKHNFFCKGIRVIAPSVGGGGKYKCRGGRLISRNAKVQCRRP